MNDGSATPFGCTVGGTGGAATSIRGNANASRSPDTDDSMRDSTTPPTPLSAPAPRKPSVINDSRRPVIGRTSEPSVGFRGVGEAPRGEQAQHCDAAHGADHRGHDVEHRRALAREHRRTPERSRRGRSRRCRPEPDGVSHRAVTAATSAITPSTTMVRKSLSAVPKVWIVHSLTGPGERSMIVEPIAVRASACGPNATARSWVTPSATAAAAMPASIRFSGAGPAITKTYLRAGPPGLTKS